MSALCAALRLSAARLKKLGILRAYSGSPSQSGLALARLPRTASVGLTPDIEICTTETGREKSAETTSWLVIDGGRDSRMAEGQGIYRMIAEWGAECFRSPMEA